MNNVYLEFLKISFRKSFAYRANSYLIMLGSIITLLIQVSLWSALLKNGSVNGVNLYDMTSYIIINTIVLSLTKTDIGNVLAEKVRDGSIAIDFIRPVKLKYFLFFDDMGQSLFRTIFSVLPVCLVSILFLKFQAPGSLLDLALFIFSLLNGIMIIYQIHYFFGLLAFWLESTWYISWYLGALLTLFGGTFVPLWFYPDFLYRLSKILPFRLVSFEPISIYLGKLSLEASIRVIASQIIWMILFTLIEKLIWNRAQNKIFVQGG